MIRLTGLGALILAVVAVSMMLYIMNPANSALVRWGAFIMGAAAVVTLALSYRSLWNRRQK